MIPVVETARLRLRAFRDDDLDAFAAMCADEEVMRHVGNGKPIERNAAWGQMAWFNGHWTLRGNGMWALALRDSDALVGRVGFLDPPGWPALEIGWLLGREHWGHGYALEAARAALDSTTTRTRARSPQPRAESGPRPPGACTARRRSPLTRPRRRRRTRARPAPR